MASVGQRLGRGGGEDPAFNRVKLVALQAEFLFQQRPLDTAVDHADSHAFTCGPRIAQQSLGLQEGEDLFEQVAGLAHGRASPTPAASSSNPSRLSTMRVQ